MVNVIPMPPAYRKLPARLRPGHPPIFDGPPSPAERAEAEALIAALDPESRRWYGRP